MTFSSLAVRSIIILSALAIICGCGKQIDNKSEEIDLAAQVNQKAIDLYQSGSTNDAIHLLEEALVNKSIDEESKYKIFGSLINIYLRCEKSEIAEKKALEAYSISPQYLATSATSIMSYYQYTGNTEALLSWSSKLVDMDIPDQLRSIAFYQMLNIYQADKQLDKAIQLINDRIQQFSSETRNNIIKSLAYQTMRSEDFDGAEQILALGNKLFPEDTDLQNISRIARIDILFNSKQWDKGIESIKAAAPHLDDKAMLGVLMRSTQLLNKHDQTEKSSLLCKNILMEHKDLSSTCNQAAITYITNANGNHPEEVARLAFLENENINDHTLFSCYRKSFYDILGGSNKETLQQLKEISEKVAISLKSETDVKHMKTFSLELAFVMEDYERAIELVKSGIEDKDESWSKLAIAKMQAHQALKENKPEEAIKHFREFMSMVAEDDEPQSDPTTGILHSKEMLLGRNAKRIGDIYLSINKQNDAANSYSEAEQYYADAKRNMDKKQARSLDLIDKETADLMTAKAELSAN